MDEENTEEAKEWCGIRTNSFGLFTVCQTCQNSVVLTGFQEQRPGLDKGGNSRRTKKNNEQSKNSARIFWTVCLTILMV